MTYATLMVQLELGHPNAGLLKITAELAERFNAGVIGIASCQPMQMMFADGYIPGDIYEQDDTERHKELDETEAAFRAALQSRCKSLEWRSSIRFAPLPEYVANEARGADLLIAGVASGDFVDSTRAVNTGDLIMQAGRPVLLVPHTAQSLSLNQVLVGWKDTRETRRAVSDALPLLKIAKKVTVVEIAMQDDMAAAHRHVQGVVDWLAQHGIEAACNVVLYTGDDAVGLYTVARDLGADLIVAGAYGRSRLVEWVLGGVTRDLLLRQDFCTLLSH
jgi:nucleotide-binding universal stress UspA family protein